MQGCCNFVRTGFYLLEHTWLMGCEQIRQLWKFTLLYRVRLRGIRISQYYNSVYFILNNL